MHINKAYNKAYKQIKKFVKMVVSYLTDASFNGRYTQFFYLLLQWACSIGISNYIWEYIDIAVSNYKSRYITKLTNKPYKQTEN